MRTIAAVMLLLAGCTKGPYVDDMQVVVTPPLYKTQFRCLTSQHYYEENRVVAMCDTKEECNKICSQLPQ